MQGLVRAQERFLDNVPSVFGIVRQAIDRVVEPVLVTADQIFEGRRPATQAFSDEPSIIGAHSSPFLDAAGGPRVP